MKKFTIFLSASLLLIVGFTSCSKTRDGLGLDTINNSAQTGRWNVRHLTYLNGTVVSDVDLTPGAGYAQFKSDNKVHFFDENGFDKTSEATSYSFVDTKTIIYGGNEYKINENLAGSFSKMTIQQTAGNVIDGYIFER